MEPMIERHTVEEWAKRKAHLPEWHESPPQRVNVAGSVKEVAAAPLRNEHHWRFVAARHLHGWPVGHELTEAEYDEAIAAAGAVRIG